jgi:hypothetical protein
MIDGKLAVQRERHKKRDYDPTVVKSNCDTKDPTKPDVCFHNSPIRHKKHKRANLFQETVAQPTA